MRPPKSVKRTGGIAQFKNEVLTQALLFYHALTESATSQLLETAKKLMTYSFPSSLAELILERWHTYVTRADIEPPAIPSLKQLRWILETIFFASLEREEGRDIRFTICCVPASTVLRDGSSAKVPLIPLSAKRPLTVVALRALAPAVRPDGAAILVEFSVDFDGLEETRIAGILHVGGDYVNARAGKSFYYQQPPYAPTIEVRGPGELHVYQGAIKLAALVSGSLEDQAIASSLDFVAATEILRAGEDALWPRIEAPEHEPPEEWASFQWTALLMSSYVLLTSLSLENTEELFFWPLRMRWAKCP